MFSKILYVQRCRQFAIPKEKISVFKQKRIPVNGSKCFLLGEPIMSQPYNSNRKQICSFQLTGRRRILLASIGCRRDWMIISLSSRSCGPLNTFQKEKKDNYLTQAMFKQYRMALAPHETIPDGVLVPIWMFFSFEKSDMVSNPQRLLPMTKYWSSIPPERTDEKSKMRSYQLKSF